MTQMQNPTDFDRDDINEAEHVAYHGVVFDFASAVFLDSDRIEIEVLRKDYGERRWNTFGVVAGICINITFTMRGDVARIFSARPAHRKERKHYGHRP